MKCIVEGCDYVTQRRINGMCVNHYQQQYEKDHPEYVEKKRASSRKWYFDNRDRCVEIRSTFKARYSQLVRDARRREVVMTLTLEQFTELVATVPCTYCGGELPKQGGGLDRKDSRQGYTTENVVPCCTKCNSIKGEDNISHEEMLYIMPLLMAKRHKI